MRSDLVTYDADGESAEEERLRVEPGDSGADWTEVVMSATFSRLPDGNR